MPALQGRHHLNCYKPISRILSWTIIYLSRQLLAGIHLPTLQCSRRIGRAALEHWFMWHFSMQGLPANDVTIISRELLPHVFTLTFYKAVIFCGTVCSRLWPEPGYSPVHCSMLSGLSSSCCQNAIVWLAAVQR